MSLPVLVALLPRLSTLGPASCLLAQKSINGPCIRVVLFFLVRCHLRIGRVIPPPPPPLSWDHFENKQSKGAEGGESKFPAIRSDHIMRREGEGDFWLRDYDGDGMHYWERSRPIYSLRSLVCTSLHSAWYCELWATRSGKVKGSCFPSNFATKILPVTYAGPKIKDVGGCEKFLPDFAYLFCVPPYSLWQ